LFFYLFLDNNCSSDFTVSNFNNIFNSHNIVFNDLEVGKENDFYMVLNIPKINLVKGIYYKDDFRNNIDKNVTLLKESMLPNEGSVLIAAHSGNSSVSFFKNLNLLEVGDEVSILYNGNNYRYVVSSYNIYDKKNLKFYTNLDEKKLVLVTCLNDYKYLIFFANLST
jgi:sortase A